MLQLYHCLCICACMCAQSCPPLCSSMDCSPPGSSVHGISQARILEWVAISFSRASSQPRDQAQVSCISCLGRWKSYNCLPCIKLSVSPLCPGHQSWLHHTHSPWWEWPCSQSLAKQPTLSYFLWPCLPCLPVGHADWTWGGQLTNRQATTGCLAASKVKSSS